MNADAILPSSQYITLPPLHILQSADSNLPPLFIMSNEDNGVPPAEPSALKSLLNPIASEGATPSSTVPEAPKSPQQDPGPITQGAPVEYQSVPPPANGDNSLPPLPTDAPVPPSPKAADEPPPVLPEGAIPPIVSTPSVFTVETPALEAPSAVAEPTPAPEVAAPAPAPEVAPPVESAPAPPAESAPAPPAESAPGPPPAALLETAPAPNEPPAPAGVIEPAPTPAEPAAQASAIPTSDAMDVDQPETSPAGSLKRSGEDLEGREEKRTRDDEVVPEAPQAPVLASAPAPAPAPPAEAPAPQTQAQPMAEAPAPAAPAQAPPAPVSQSHIIVPGVGTVPVVIPPPPVASGPTTPLTLTQHKHMLSCIRSLKKNKDAALFLEPVNPVLFGIPHYPDIIKNPMDLGTVETKLIVSDPRGPPKDKSKMGKWDQSKGKYNSVADVSLDVRQIFWNTARFNGMDHVVTQAATRLDAVFAKMIANIPAEVSFTLRLWTELMY
jgi:bromodomain-containing factor 1